MTDTSNIDPLRIMMDDSDLPAHTMQSYISLPLPTREPPSRPYTATGAASARTSFTRVDVDSNPPLHSFLAVESVLLPDEPVLTRDSQVSGPPDEHELEQQAREPENMVPQTPQTTLTFLLVSGRRRTMSFEPGTTVGRVKELVWNAWPCEWQDERPPAPSYLRILYLGKILQDDDTLTKLNFPSYTPTSQAQPTSLLQATIVHLSIRPSGPTADDEGLKKKRRSRRRPTADSLSEAGDGADVDTREGTGCCGGCIIC